MDYMKNNIFLQTLVMIILCISSSIYLCSCSQNPDISHKVFTNLKERYPLYTLVNDTTASMSDIFGVECDEVLIFDHRRSDIGYVLDDQSFTYRNSPWDVCSYVVIRNKGKIIRSGNWFSEVIMCAFKENRVVPSNYTCKKEPYHIPDEHTCVYGHLYADSLSISKYSEIQYCLSPICFTSCDTLLDTRLNVRDSIELCRQKKPRGAYQNANVTSFGYGLAMWNFMELVSGDSMVTFYVDSDLQEVKCTFNLFSLHDESLYPMPFLYKPSSNVFYFIVLEHTDRYMKILYNNADIAYLKNDGSFKYAPWADFLRHDIIGVRQVGGNIVNQVFAVWNNKILIRDECSKWHIIPWKQDDIIIIDIIVF